MRCCIYSITTTLYSKTIELSKELELKQGNKYGMI